MLRHGVPSGLARIAGEHFAAEIHGSQVVRPAAINELVRELILTAGPLDLLTGRWIDTDNELWIWRIFAIKVALITRIDRERSDDMLSHNAVE